MRKISILGSTGSIGTQTLEVVEILENINVMAITGNSNVKLLEEQARKFQPELIAVMDEKNAEILKEKLSDLNIRVVSGMNGLVEAATYEGVDTVVTSVVGNVGLKPTFEAIRAGKSPMEIGSNGVAEQSIAKAYEMMSCFEGLCEYHRATGDTEALETVKLFWDKVAQ